MVVVIGVCKDVHMYVCVFVYVKMYICACMGKCVCVCAYRDIVWASKVSNHTGTGAYPHVTDKRENPSENVCACWI